MVLVHLVSLIDRVAHVTFEGFAVSDSGAKKSLVICTHLLQLSDLLTCHEMSKYHILKSTLFIVKLAIFNERRLFM